MATRSKKSAPKKSVAKKSAPKKSVAKKSAAKKSVGKKSACVRRTTAKYTCATRTSPPFPANQCRGETKRGNDKTMYRSTQNKNKVYTWKKVK